VSETANIRESLLLDPALSADLLATLRRQTASSNIELIDVPMSDGMSTRDALRAASDVRKDAIVALATEDDAAFFEGRERRFSVMIKHHRFGATLTSYPRLIPALPPTLQLSGTRAMIAGPSHESRIRTSSFPSRAHPAACLLRSKSISRSNA
jgi:hypothetical protein